jgi:membrane associated rhomboid family serine protease
MLKKKSIFGNPIESISYSVLLLVLLWSIYLLESFYPNEFISYGILPKSINGLKGILFSPLIHSPSDVFHLINNSLPAGVLLAAIFYYYREIAFKIVFFSWIMSGFFVWAFATNNNSYHIGFSGVIYAFVGFLFTSGTIRKFRPLQGISLFVVFVYGSLIWGIFPSEERISWEGHLSGLFVGVLLAFIYRKQGPQAPKFQFEIEKEMGIEPPDLEAIWRENQELLRQEKEINEQNSLHYKDKHHLDSIFGEKPTIKYDYKEDKKK